MRFIGLPILCCCIGFILGCQNPYAKFYATVITEEERSNLRPFSGETRFVSASSMTEHEQLSKDLIVRQGYALLGYVSFESGGGNYTADVKARAKEIGADVALLYAGYARTVEGVAPVTTVQPGHTSLTSSTGTINATTSGIGGTAQGSATYNGQTVTTTSPTYNTTYIPYKVDRHNFVAGFFRKRTFPFGVYWAPLSDEQRKSLQRNGGLVVKSVVEGAPAFDANILVGDILVSIDGQPITTSQSFSRQLLSLNGRTVPVGILRQGAAKTITVRIGSGTE